MVDRIGHILLRAAHDLGVADPRIFHGGKHPRIEGTVDGGPLWFAFPKSASDWRSALDALSQLRREVVARRTLLPRSAQPSDAKREFGRSA